MGLLHIDKGRLDEELVKLPQDIHDHSVRLANAKAAVDALDNELKLAEATLGAAIRLNPSAYGIGDKPTVGAIDGAVLCNAQIQEIKGRLLAAKHAVDLTWAVVNGLAAKREAIQPLVKLYLNDYYSSPQPADVEEAKAASGKVETNGPPAGKSMPTAVMPEVDEIGRDSGGTVVAKRRPKQAKAKPVDDDVVASGDQMDW